ncbi:PRC-barrel domain-containing protein [Burkholderia plantarii]|uniref:PRC-barrel domain protein n=1 Tax=Burkholderia plantarii TaxID=41899 RepID=A0A0B6RQK5_BURPL|nr:PRC-barrel domain-containing protein [Burkholderia plantarii]AJK45663.1 PRC-barrel domain protein [Burkholderia plantarii]ALK29913.1 PRC-barrel domain-containing protein [Burkholderia plantarii]WLE58662.1 PRC-barrel domain-containing protein [Burkholderia plantarii]GLZ20839.1 hypothetical protein Bpla01_43680 [Burkholderia plantarii]
MKTPDTKPAGSRSGPLAGYRETDPSGALPIAAHTLEGASVRADDDVDVGHVSDLLLDLGGGRITHVLVTSAKGQGDRLIAIPWQALAADTEGKGLRVAVSSERVFAAPDFDRNQLPSARPADWASSIERHFGSRA